MRDEGVGCGVEGVLGSGVGLVVLGSQGFVGRWGLSQGI